MRKQLHLPCSRRVPFVPLSAPFETIISGFTDDEADEILDEELFVCMMSRAADGDTNFEIGASPELARQLNVYFGRNVVHSDMLD